MDDLLLISGNDIPFPRAELTIHQPTVEEIAFIGEQTFFTGVNYLNFRKSHLMLEEQEQLEDAFILANPCQQHSVRETNIYLLSLYPISQLKSTNDVSIP